MSFTAFFQENRDEIQTAILTLRDMSQNDPTNAMLYRAAKKALVAVMQKSVWLVDFEAYQDGAAFKNAVFASGFIQAYLEQYLQAAADFDANNIPLFSSKEKLLAKCMEEINSFNSSLMATSVSI